MIDISKIVEGSSNTDPISVFLTDFQMSSATNDGLLKLAHHLQGVTQVAGCFCFTQSISHRSSQGEIVLVILHGLHVVAHVEVGVAKLAVDGAQRSEIVCSSLKIEKKIVMFRSQNKNFLFQLTNRYI